MLDKTALAILEKREQQYNYQLQLWAKTKKGQLIVNLNIPGQEKESQLLYKFFNKFVVPKLFNFLNSLNIKYLVDKNSFIDKKCYLLIQLEKTCDYNELKEKLINFENTDSSFQLVDFDIYNHNHEKVTRESLGKKPRKCYLCLKPAKLCSRNKTHGIVSVKNFINKIITETL